MSNSAAGSHANVYSLITFPTVHTELFSDPMRPHLHEIMLGIHGLQRNPRPEGCKQEEFDPNMYYVRIGKFEILYKIEEDPPRVIIIRVWVPLFQ